MKTFESSTYEEFLNDPTEYGAPSFEEFVRNPQKFRNPDTFDLASNGSKLLKNVQKKQEYEFMGYRTSKLEHIENMLKSEGLTTADVDMAGEIIPDVGLKCTILIKFTKKENLNGSNINT